MKQHKWAKEIKAWADGAEIEYFSESKSLWIFCRFPEWEEEVYYRIAPTQPKEQQYLYVYKRIVGGNICLSEENGWCNKTFLYLGKTKLED